MKTFIATVVMVLIVLVAIIFKTDGTDVETGKQAAEATESGFDVTPAGYFTLTAEDKRMAWGSLRMGMDYDEVEALIGFPPAMEVTEEWTHYYYDNDSVKVTFLNDALYKWEVPSDF